MLASLMAGSSSGMASPGLISLTLRLIGQFFVFWFNGVSGFLLVYEFLSLAVCSVGPTSHVKKTMAPLYCIFSEKGCTLFCFFFFFRVRASSLNFKA